MTPPNWTDKLNPHRHNLRRKILQDPYYRFQSWEEIAIAAEMGVKIEVNQAGVDDWLRLPGISIRQARTLVELVGMGMQFLCLEDLAAALSLPPQRLKPLAPLLSFAYYEVDSPLTPQRIDLNTARVEQLKQIPYLDPCEAELIVGERRENGAYQNLPDFQRRLGFSSQLMSQLMHYLQV